MGDKDNFRIPDRGYHRARPNGAWIETCALVVEILSPDDETFDKFDFYDAHGVAEILLVDPNSRSMRCRQLSMSAPYPVDYDSMLADTSLVLVRSEVLALDLIDLANRIDWP